MLHALPSERLCTGRGVTRHVAVFVTSDRSGCGARWGSPAAHGDLELRQRLPTAARVGTGAVNILQVVLQPQKYPCVGNPEQAERHQPLVPFPVAACPGLKDESPDL